MDRAKPPLIGVAGGIASGKSYVAEQLARKGARIVSADRLAHEVLQHDDVKQQLRERWGEAIFDPRGAIDRQQVAKIVFAPPPDGPRELKYLEQLTHPKIGELVREQVLSLSSCDDVSAIVLDVPLLLEAGWDKLCDKVVYIDAPREVRLARARARGWTDEEFDRREALQQALDVKKQRADWVFDNSQQGETLASQVDRFWQTCLAAQAAP